MHPILRDPEIQTMTVSSHCNRQLSLACTMSTARSMQLAFCKAHSSVLALSPACNFSSLRKVTLSDNEFRNRYASSKCSMPKRSDTEELNEVKWHVNVLL